MVFGLVLHIRYDATDMGAADAKYAVAFLPPEYFFALTHLSGKPGRRPFDLLRQK